MPIPTIPDKRPDQADTTLSARPVAVVCNLELYPAIAPALHQWMGDVDTDTLILCHAATPPQVIRAALQQREVVGVLFVGPTPYARLVQVDNRQPRPIAYLCDTYFMDLDGDYPPPPVARTWERRDCTPGTQLRAWCGRLWLPTPDPALYIAYFARNHAWRQHQALGLPASSNALIYIDEPWLSRADMGVHQAWPQAVSVAETDRAHALEMCATPAPWYHIVCHGSVGSLSVSVGRRNEVIRTADLDATPPQATGMTILACHTGYFLSPSSLAARCLLGAPLVVLASTNINTFSSTDAFYRALATGARVGEAWLALFQHATLGVFTPWSVGYVLLGDPTLRIAGPQCSENT